MLHVLTAQILADERERAIQRRLRILGLRREARVARSAGAAPSTPRHDASAHPKGQRCGDCPQAAAPVG